MLSTAACKESKNLLQAVCFLILVVWEGFFNSGKTCLHAAYEAHKESSQQSSGALQGSSCSFHGSGLFSSGCSGLTVLKLAVTLCMFCALRCDELVADAHE